MSIRTVKLHSLPTYLTNLIPPEIYDQIISHLSKDRLSLNSCCLVCKAWLPTSRYWLFATSKVTVLRTNVDRFLELVDNRCNPCSIAPFIQHLVLEQGGSNRLPFWGAYGNHEDFQFNDFLSQFDGLASLKSLRLGWIRADIGPSVPIALRSNFHSLNELELNSVVLSSVQQFFDILGSLPRLVVLCLCGFSFEYEIMDGHIQDSTPLPPPLHTFNANVNESITRFLFAWLAFHGMPTLHTVAFGLFSRQTNEGLSEYLRQAGYYLRVLKIWDAYTAVGIDLSPCLYLESLRLGWICLLPELLPGSVTFATEVLKTVNASCLEEVTIVIRLEKGAADELEAFDWDGLAALREGSDEGCWRKVTHAL
ncbi:hypothetical protein VKT23_017430 [Stygiomarasmius scandens]|uniref:F-box domain-containing protein n=1 Tax=Marasmiellus scandens TaxID=2682957 RepID=A0ABR1ISE2_9AGAR